LHILSSGGDPFAIWQHCRRRGETLADTREARYSSMEIDVAHIFSGHEIQMGGRLSISAQNRYEPISVKLTVEEATERERDLFATYSAGTENLGGFLVLRILASPPSPSNVALPLSRRGGIALEALDLLSRRQARRSRISQRNSLYVSTESLSSDEVVRLWEALQLTPQEEMVLKALRYLDPKIERIAPVSSNRPYDVGRASFIVKMEDHTSPFPIGSLGGGIWRMLSMALAITQCRDGMLLIDEIDTGLHYTVMRDMWKLIFTAAEEFGVQVFATTHSDDCIKSLAMICHTDILEGNQITIQRIEAGRCNSVPYTEPEIRMAAEKGIEMR
jgi:hypothetical protein